MAGEAPAAHGLPAFPAGPVGRRQANLRRARRIKDIWSANREVYGRPGRNCRPSGEWIGAKRVGRLMHAAGIFGASRRRSAKNRATHVGDSA